MPLTPTAKRPWALIPPLTKLGMGGGRIEMTGGT